MAGSGINRPFLSHLDRLQMNLIIMNFAHRDDLTAAVVVAKKISALPGSTWCDVRLENISFSCCCLGFLTVCVMVSRQSAESCVNWTKTHQKICCNEVFNILTTAISRDSTINIIQKTGHIINFVTCAAADVYLDKIFFWRFFFSDSAVSQVFIVTGNPARMRQWWRVSRAVCMQYLGIVQIFRRKWQTDERENALDIHV